MVPAKTNKPFCFKGYFLGFQLILFAHLLAAQEPVQIQRLSPADLSAHEFFGSSISFGEQFGVIGAYLNDDKGRNAGSAYIYARNGDYWVLHSKIYASDAQADNYFGHSVYLQDDYILIGAAGDDGNEVGAGSVYVFHYDGKDWIEQSRLVTSDGNTGDFLGHNISLNGQYALISASGDDDYGPYSGSAYIFHHDGDRWIEQTKLTASDAQENVYFGNAVALYEDYAFVGAYHENELGYRSGAVYVFVRIGNQWVEQQKLTNWDSKALTIFGISISVNDSLALIGAVGESTNGSSAGAVYVYRLDDNLWKPQTKLLASDGKTNDHFGNAVHFNGKNAIIGAYADDEAGQAAGSAYVFSYDGTKWSEQAKILAEDGKKNDSFGRKVSIGDGFAVVSSNRSSIDKRYSGAAYHFSFTGTPPLDECRFLKTSVDLGPSDTLVCDQESITLEAEVPDDAQYLWSTGSDSSQIQVTRSGKYWVEVRQNDCVATDTIVVEFFHVDLGEDTIFCHAIDHTLAVEEDQVEIRWSTGQTERKIHVTEPGVYWVEVVKGNCTIRDSINIELLSPPNLGPDTVLCGLTRHTLKSQKAKGSILWSTGETSDQISVLKSGIYWVQVSNGNCAVYDSIEISMIEVPRLPKSIDTLICQEETFIWSSQLQGYNYLWEDGRTSSERTFDTEGTYRVKMENECHSFEQSISIRIEDCNCEIFIPNVFTPNDDGKNDLFQADLHQKLSKPTLLIYNRWGKLVYKNVESLTWDGNFHSKEAPAGNYYWVIEYNCHESSLVAHKQLNGWLTLMR